MKNAGCLSLLVLLSQGSACEPDAPIARQDLPDPGDHKNRDAQADVSEQDAGYTKNDAGPTEQCTATPPPGRLCVRGEQGQGGEALTAQTPVTLQVYPEGCISSGCTIVARADCSATMTGATINVRSDFCLNSQDDQCVPTPDCGGADLVASCDSGATLPDGTYTAKIGDLSVSFTIPSQLPLGGACDGDPFQ